VKILLPKKAEINTGSDEASRVSNKTIASLFQQNKKLKVAYLSNGKPNAKELFSSLDKRLINCFRDKIDNDDSFEIRYFEKKRAGIPADPEMLQQIKNYADLAITGSAD